MRQPYNILLIPFIQTESIRYAIFKRSDGEIIQFIAGGVEDDETYLGAAIREGHEEAGILNSSKFMALESTCLMSADIFKEFRKTNIEHVKEMSFAVALEDELFNLSREHDYYEWVNYNEALERLTFESNKLALKELHAILRGM